MIDSEVQKLQAFVRRCLADHRFGWEHRRPQDLANEFLQDVAFRDIKFARFLDSPDGQAVTTIVVEAMPYPYNVGVDVLVKAIMLAAQQRTDRQIGSTLVAGLAVVGLSLWVLDTFGNGTSR